MRTPSVTVTKPDRVVAGAVDSAIGLTGGLVRPLKGFVFGASPRDGRQGGTGIMCKAIEMSLVDWRRQTAVNLDGVFLSVKYVVPAMRAPAGGSIIIMSSVADLRGSAGLAGCCADERRRAPVRESTGRDIFKVSVTQPLRSRGAASKKWKDYKADE
jgi:NAD(P)-dependent dehydrogenase (short-subunit alcohol dehydrogenase family)